MQRRTLTAVVMAVLCISIGFTLSAFPASAAGSEARIGMPFTGNFANSLSDPATHPVYFSGGQWSTDLYAPEGTNVAINMVAASGPIVIKVEAAGPLNSCNGVSPGAYAKLGISVSGTRIGQVLYEHLSGLQVSTGQTIPNGTVLGKTHWWPYSSCYQVSTAAGIHTHIEVGSSSGTACYVGRPLGTRLTSTDTIGAVGGGYTTKRCPSPLPALAPTSQTFADGTFVRASDTGRVYRIAGGAPLWLSTCVDGCPGLINTTQSVIDSLRSVPADGTTLQTLETGRIYKVAGGAPLWLSSCNADCGAPVKINQWTVDTLNHLRSVPADGTMLRAVETGRIYQVMEGSPIYLSACPPEGCIGVVNVNQWTIDTRDHLGT